MIDVQLDSAGTRRQCLACGGEIEKFEVHGVAVVGHPFELCQACMLGGAAAANLRSRAEDVRHWADWIESLADETWQFPTEAEVWAAEAQQEADWIVLAAEEGLTL